MSRRGLTNKRTWYQLLALSTVLLFSSAAWSQDADDVDADEDETKELQKVRVVGSRISRTDIEGPSPVVIMTSEQIEQEGWTTINEALRTLTQNSNFGQTEGDGGTFTQNANAIDLRGLGPGRTLLLLDGRRITDYPLPFNGQSNLQNLESLPIAAIERIEILAGGASAIYGSDAVAGVVNFITKKELDSHTITLRYGDTTQGGGESYRLQASGGFMGDRWNFTYAVEYLKREPIWGFDREFMDSAFDNPDPTVNVVNARNPLFYNPWDYDGDGFIYHDPGQERCDAMPYQEYSFRSSGYYCGQADLVGQFTFRSERENISVFTNGSFEVTDNSQLYGSLNYWKGESEFTTGDPFWFPTDAGAQILNAGQPGFLPEGRYDIWQRRYDLREIGLNNNANEFKEDVIDFTIGMRGIMFDKYDWDLYYNRQEYNVERNRTLQIESKVNEYFLGDFLGYGSFGLPVWEVPDNWKMYEPMTPEIWDSITDNDKTVADSSNQVAQFVLNGDMFELPAGPLSFAIVAEWGSQKYDIDLDDKFGSFDPDTGEVITPNLYWGFTATGGGGKRDRLAAGLELRIPIVESVVFNAAFRYDHYDDITEVDGAPTYNLGLEWRPTSNLLVRGSYATTFRAPDMHYIFAAPSGFFTTVTDQYRCRRDEPGVPFAQCTIPTANPFGRRQGNPLLEEETGKSYTFGFVWEIMDTLSVSVDYWDIEIEDMVADLSTTLVLEREADCRLGETEGGVPVDINSLECRDALNRVGRDPIIGGPNDEQISTLTIGPVNRAFQHTSGIDAHLNWALNTDNAGSFVMDLGYTNTLDDEGYEFEGDPVENFRDDLQNFNWRSRFRGSLTWRYADFTTTLFGDYRGSLPNWAETDRTKGSYYFNWTASYDFTPRQRLSLIVQNLFDNNPTVDDTFDSYPYFLFYNFDPTGREIFLQYAIVFDNK